MTITALAPTDLDVDQRALYDAITTGARGSGVQHFQLTDAAGRLHGPFGLMLHVPRVGMPLQALGSALRFETELTDREREIAILTVARIADSAFERHAHAAVGAAVGLSPEELTALQAGTFIGQDAREDAVAALSARLADTAVVRPGDLDETLPHGIVLELVAMAGYYRLLAQMMGLFDIGAPVPAHADPDAGEAR
jgi:4-carboxymuconolactone decarboxylase